MDLTDFVLERIAEEESAWLDLGGRHRDFEQSARAGLARCVGKRTVVARYLDMCTHALLSQLQALAPPYYDHPEYQRDWQPRDL
ncbi:MAG: DUF6221 family protein [Marmoricola sp.]